jgi:acetyltransferase-like isoleucine patch superfamily enzyme
MKTLFKRILFTISSYILRYAEQARKENVYKKYSFPKSVRFEEVSFNGDVTIGERTYINDWSRIDSGSHSKVVIGRDCAIGRFVHITSKTHDLNRPTTDEDNFLINNIEADTIICNEVWIGDFVFIGHGITIGNNAIIGTHSFVNRNVEPFEIVGGIPIRHIRYNDKHPLRRAIL